MDLIKSIPQFTYLLCEHFRQAKLQILSNEIFRTESYAMVASILHKISFSILLLSFNPDN